MSDDNAQVVRRWIERLAAGDLGIERCHPEIEIRNWSEMPLPGPYHGHEGARRWWADVNDSDVATDMQLFDLREVEALDDGRVLTVQRAHTHTRYTGMDLEFTWASILSVRDGQIASAHGYPTTEEAKRAAGLSD